MLWEAGRVAVSHTVSYGLGKMREGLMECYKRDIAHSVQTAIEEVYREEGVMAHLSDILSFDSVSQQGWQVRAQVSYGLKAWDTDRIGPVLSTISAGFQLISAYNDNVSLTVALEAMSAVGGLAAQYAALKEYLGGYIAEMRRLIAHAYTEDLKPIDAVLEKAVPTVAAEKRAEWISGLRDTGVLRGDVCYRLATGEAASQGWVMPKRVNLITVDRDVPATATTLHRLETQVGMDEAHAVMYVAQYQALIRTIAAITGRVCGIATEDTAALYAHPLTQWAGNTVRVVMEGPKVLLAKDKADSFQRLYAAFAGKINNGVATHVQGMMQQGIMTGVGAVMNSIKAKVDADTRRELEGKANLTEDEALELLAMRTVKSTILDCVLRHYE